jgi:DNA-binding Xre family transcriptional regulator
MEDPMPTSGRDAPITWHLRQLMAAAGMFHTTDLIEPLRAHGVQLSREQVFRLVTKTPERLNVEVLAALCRILGCTPTDLIEVRATQAEPRRAAGSGRTSSGPAIGTLRPIPAKLHRPAE